MQYKYGKKRQTSNIRFLENVEILFPQAVFYTSQSSLRLEKDQYHFQNGPCSVKFWDYLGVKMINIAEIINKRKMSVPKDHQFQYD